jgi:DNA-binding response OmpR family regulator
MLARAAGAIVSREEIYRSLRGIEYDGLDRSMDVRIVRLRRKLGDDSKAPTLIKNVRGEGYLLSRQP